MKELLLIAIGSALVNNVVLSQFLGLCPFLGVSKKVETSAGMGAAVIFVITIASAVTSLVYTGILVNLHLEYLQTIVFILVIAALVQFVEMFLKKSMPSLYEALGVYLPLITTNCAVLGVTLLVYSAAAAVIVTVASRGPFYIPWRDIFWTDYQTTDSFHSFIEARLYELASAADTPEEENPLEGWDDGLLYRVRADGVLKFSNTDALSPDRLPDGYNFLITYDGEKVTAVKDGRDISSQFSPLPFADPAGVSVSLAAAEHPPASGSSSLASLVGSLRQNRAFFFCFLFLPPLAGIALTALSIVWHRHKVRADRAIAWFTGRVWLEVKLLLLVPFLWVCALAGMCCLAALMGEVLTYSIVRYLSVPLALWWAYLYINDLRYNFGHLKEQSLCAACVRLLRRQILRHPAAQRADRRMIWQFAACLPFFLFCALSVPVFLLFRLPLPLLLLLCMAGIVLIGLQVWLVRESRRSAAELDALLACIEAAGAGRLEGAPPLPPDSDFHGAAEQLSHMEEGLRTALAEQVRSERMKVELITNVSHDLKTPLTSIISYTELLQQEEGLPDHVQDYIRVLSDKSKRLQVMVRDVFEVSKAATGNLSVDIKPIDFAKLLRQTLADMGEAIEESGLALRPRLPESPVWIAADGDRLYRVFQNLIGNALKYSLEGSRIYLELTAADGQAAAVLRNTSREELPDGVDLTERFVRGDQSRTDGGSGLGLSIARSFTEACGGTFSVQTQADLFTASVSFPLTRERPPKEESAV